MAAKADPYIMDESGANAMHWAKDMAYTDVRVCSYSFIILYTWQVGTKRIDVYFTHPFMFTNNYHDDTSTRNTYAYSAF